MSPANYAIPIGSWVLITGANGYIASHVTDILLELGYKVRGSVRSEKPWLNEYFDNKYGPGKFEAVVVAGFEQEGAFDEAAKGVAGIVHVASDVSLDPDPKVVIPKVLQGTRGTLEAAAKQPSVKRFVLTSSSTAVLTPNPNVKGIVVDENTWNDGVVKAAWSESAPESVRPLLTYSASKTEGEREAWKWVAEHKPGFVFNSVLPSINFGKILLLEKFQGGTMGAVRSLLNGDSWGVNVFPPQYYVDVRDTARLHVVALLDPAVQSERIFAFAYPQNWTEVIAILRKLRPNNDKIPDPPVNEGHDLSEVKPSKRAEELLKSFFGLRGWTGLEDSIAAGIEDLQ